MQKIKKMLTYFLIFSLLSLASGYITFKVLSISRIIAVPDLKGKSLKEAQDLTAQNSLTLKVEAEDYDPYVPEGYVLSQDIAAGSTLKGHGEIKVVISKGHMTHLTPSLTGKTLNEVRTLLSGVGLEVSNVIGVRSNTAEQGRVIAQQPLPEEPVGAITLIVSKGPYDVIYYCPSFEGMSKEDALDFGQKIGLNIKVKGNGQAVISQRPEPGAMINNSTIIEIQVNKGGYE